MEAFLNAYLPRFIPDDCGFDVHSHKGKHDLLRKLSTRLEGYANWLPFNHRVVVIVDLDSCDCRNLKSELEQICADARLRSKKCHRWSGLANRDQDRN